jgi:hypothetical protein
LKPHLSGHIVFRRRVPCNSATENIFLECHVQRSVALGELFCSFQVPRKG